MGGRRNNEAHLIALLPLSNLIRSEAKNADANPNKQEKHGDRIHPEMVIAPDALRKPVPVVAEHKPRVIWAVKQFLDALSFPSPVEDVLVDANIVYEPQKDEKHSRIAEAFGCASPKLHRATVPLVLTVKEDPHFRGWNFGEAQLFGIPRSIDVFSIFRCLRANPKLSIREMKE